MQNLMKLAIFGNILLLLFMQSTVSVQNTVCKSCDGPNNETCEEKDEVCPDGTSCITICEVFSALGKKFLSVHKRCARNLPCGRIYAHAGSDMYVDANLICCTGDRCNSGKCNFPQRNLTEKGEGILCPICYKYGTLDGCNATRSTVCWEKDDLCVKFRGTGITPDGVPYNFSAQGCSSKLACGCDYTELAGMKIKSYKEYECYVPKSSPAQYDDKPPF